MNNHVRVLIYLATCWTISDVSGQYYYYNSRFYESPVSWEAAIAAGGMNGLTDLGGKSMKGGNMFKDLAWKHTRMALNIGGKLVYQEKLAIAMQGCFGSMAAADNQYAIQHTAPGRYRRNLQVESNILEWLVLAELYPLTLLSAGEHPVYWLVPYLMAGIGGFHFNPVARNGEARVRLHPLRTEGQGFPEYPDRKPYSLNQWNLPVGIGVRHQLSGIFHCAVELLYRKLFTDYLDDVSKTYIAPETFYRHMPAATAQLATTMADRHMKTAPPHREGERRGNPGKNDAYFTAMFKLGLAIGRERR